MSGTYTLSSVSHVEVLRGLAIRLDVGSTILKLWEASYRSTVRLSGQPLRRCYVLPCNMSWCSEGQPWQGTTALQTRTSIWSAACCQLSIRTSRCGTWHDRLQVLLHRATFGEVLGQPIPAFSRGRRLPANHTSQFCCD